MKTTHLASLMCILGLIAMFGCSENQGPCPVHPLYHETLYQAYPSWVTQDLLYFENHAPDSAQQSLAQAYNDSVRICAYSVSTMEVYEVASHGVRPKGQPTVGKAVWHAPGFSGALKIGDFSGWEELEESSSWESRNTASLSPSGTFLAWQSMGEDHQRGVWVYNRETAVYHFLGDGHSPVWHPQLDKVYFTGGADGEGAILKIGIGEEWEAEIVASMPHDVSAANYAFSPNGEFLAFSNPGYPSQDGIWTFEMATSEFEFRLPSQIRGMTWGAQGIVIGTGCPDEEDPGCGKLWLVDPETWEIEALLAR